MITPLFCHPLHGERAPLPYVDTDVQLGEGEGSRAYIKPLLEKIQKTNFRFSESILKDILKEANE